MTTLNDNMTALKELTEKTLSTGASGTIHEEMLRDQNEIFRLVIDSVCEGVIVADTKEKFLIFNQAAEKMFGYGASSSKAKDWARKYCLFRSDKETPFPVEKLPLYLAIRGLETNNEIMYVKVKGKEPIWVSINGRPLRDRLGKLIGGIIVARQIPEQIL